MTTTVLCVGMDTSPGWSIGRVHFLSPPSYWDLVLIPVHVMWTEVTGAPSGLALGLLNDLAGFLSLLVGKQNAKDLGEAF